MRPGGSVLDLGGRLLAAPQPMPDAADLVPDFRGEVPPALPPVPAAVLIALVRRAGGWTVLYTARSPLLRRHSGQVAFPGGRIDPEDPDAAHAALREAREEVALDPDDAEILGYMPYYFTGSNYFITPVVAVVEPRRAFVPNPGEVDAVFEVPLDVVSDAGRYSRRSVFREGREHRSWQLDHEGHRIWGITANLTRRFRDEVLVAPAGR